MNGLDCADLLEENILEEDPETVLACILYSSGGASTRALAPRGGDMHPVHETPQCDVLSIPDQVMTGGGRSGRSAAAHHWGVDADPFARRNELLPRFLLIGDLRGHGLRMASELTSDRKARLPLPVNMNPKARQVEIADENEQLIHSMPTQDGILGDYVLDVPPMITSEVLFDAKIERLDRSFYDFIARRLQLSSAA